MCYCLVGVVFGWYYVKVVGVVIEFGMIVVEGLLVVL